MASNFENAMSIMSLLTMRDAKAFMVELEMKVLLSARTMKFSSRTCYTTEEIEMRCSFLYGNSLAPCYFGFAERFYCFSV